MTDKELMQQALDALKSTGLFLHHCWCDVSMNDYSFGKLNQQMEIVDDQIAALRERLAQPEQEPVAWANEIIDDLHAQYNTDGIKEIDSGDALIRLDEAIAAVEEAEKRHTTPAKRKPLTDEEIRRIELTVHGYTRQPLDVKAFARAIEAAHGIGEKPDAA